MAQTQTLPAAGFPFQRAYDVAQTVCDARHVAETLADLVPENIDSIDIQQLSRLQSLASAIGRLMAGAEDAADALAGELHDVHIVLNGGR